MNTNNASIMINIDDFTKICRICLCSDDLHSILEHTAVNLYKSITDVEICENDLLPKNVCRKCAVELENVSAFIDKCKSNNLLLIRISLNVQKGNESDEFDNDNTIITPYCVGQSKASTECNLNKFRSHDIGKWNCSNCKIDVPQHGLKKHYRLNPQCRPKEFICPVCEKSFYPRYKLAIHLRSHKKKTSYNCPKCLKSFAFAENLRKHALTHKGVKPFVCEICEKGFLRKRSLDEHMNFHTGKTPYVCAYCGKGFKRLTDHASHIYRLHNINIAKIPKHQQKYTEKRVNLNLDCKLCGKVFASRSGYANHQLIHEGIKRFLCNLCGRKFITNPTLQNHIRTHTGEKPFQCNECDKSFKQRNSLNTHMFQHATDMNLNNCPKCAEKFSTKIDLNAHILTHFEEKSFKCNRCNRRFDSELVLQNHVASHKEKHHKCKLCTKSFMSPSHLSVHMRTHSGEKPYSCEVCGKQLAQPQTLKVHMRQHTGEKPYICSLCDKSFHDSSNFKRHFQRHHGNNKGKDKVISKNTESGEEGIVNGS